MWEALEKLLAYPSHSAELMEAIWVAAEMRAGGAYAHSMFAALAEEEESRNRSTL